MNKEEVITILGNHSSELRELGIKSLDLFGSVARGEATEQSDVDLLVEFDRPIGLFHLVKVQLYLEEILKVEKVDLATPSSVRPRIRDRVMREAVHAF